MLLLTAIAAGLGATSLAYTVLDNGRITAVGVLLSFALLLQFASFLVGRAARRTPSRERCACTGAGWSRCSSTARS